MKDSIKAGELRCGNWVNYKGEPIMATMIGEYGIQSKTEDCTINAKFQFDISPIPLSKEVLEKVKGCELISESPYRATWDIEYGGGRYISVVNYKVDKTWEVTFGSSIVLKASHLHILQNVVYFNWDKELEITL